MTASGTHEITGCRHFDIVARFCLDWISAGKGILRRLAGIRCIGYGFFVHGYHNLPDIMGRGIYGRVRYRYGEFRREFVCTIRSRLMAEWQQRV